MRGEEVLRCQLQLQVGCTESMGCIGHTVCALYSPCMLVKASKRNVQHKVWIQPLYLVHTHDTNVLATLYRSRAKQSSVQKSDLSHLELESQLLDQVILELLLVACLPGLQGVKHTGDCFVLTPVMAAANHCSEMQGIQGIIIDNDCFAPVACKLRQTALWDACSYALLTVQLTAGGLGAWLTDQQ